MYCYVINGNVNIINVVLTLWRVVLCVCVCVMDGFYARCLFL